MIYSDTYRQTISFGIGMLFSTLFLYAATKKLLNYREFGLRLAEPTLFSDYAGTLAWIVPVLELVVALLLFINLYRHPAMYASLVLIILYTAYILLLLTYSAVMPCSCIGPISALGWVGHILLNIALMVLAVAGIHCSKKYKFQLEQDTT